MIRLATPRSFAGTLVSLGLWGACLSSGGVLLASPPPQTTEVAIPRGLTVATGQAGPSMVAWAPGSTMLALLAVGGPILLAPYLRRKTRVIA